MTSADRPAAIADKLASLERILSEQAQAVVPDSEVLLGVIREQLLSLDAKDLKERPLLDTADTIVRKSKLEKNNKEILKNKLHKAVYEFLLALDALPELTPEQAQAAFPETFSEPDIPVVIDHEPLPTETPVLDVEVPEFENIDIENAATDIENAAVDIENVAVDTPQIANKEGFHLIDPGQVDPAFIPESRVTIATNSIGDFYAVETPNLPPTEPKDSWQIRTTKKKKHKPTGSLYIRTAHSRGRFEDIEEMDESVLAVDQEVQTFLQNNHCEIAAARLQRAAQEIGGRQIAEIALDAGDRARAIGKPIAATNCYLAASRADPAYESPLVRLADTCLDNHDINLASSYLERVARLARMRDDTNAAVRMYRKIVTVDPTRNDILEILMRARTTGSLDA